MMAELVDHRHHQGEENDGECLKNPYGQGSHRPPRRRRRLVCIFGFHAAVLSQKSCPEARNRFVTSHRWVDLATGEMRSSGHYFALGISPPLR